MIALEAHLLPPTVWRHAEGFPFRHGLSISLEDEADPALAVPPRLVAPPKSPLDAHQAVKGNGQRSPVRVPLVVADHRAEVLHHGQSDRRVN
eukprot:scaffold384_cov238-Pinguiococcus_pyrenoidosus.AAC.6